jgi:integrase
MTVYKRPNGRWAAQIYDRAKGSPRQIGTFSTRKEARKAEQEAISRSTVGGAESIESFAARWPAEYPRPRASTNKHNAERVKAFAKEYGKRRIDSITSEEARSWGLAHHSQIYALRAMLNDARRDGIITTNPFTGLGIERTRGRRDLPSDWLTADDVNELAKTACSCHGAYGAKMAAMVVFAAYTGVRPGELFALRLDDLGKDTINVRRSADSKTRTVGLTKNGRAREIVYPHVARDAIAKAPKFEGQELVFPGLNGQQLWSSAFSWLWSPVRAAFGRPKMAFYELRHFAATHLLELGLSPADVAVQLGHTDGGALVMSTYGHPSERAARARILTALDGHDQGELAPLRRRAAGSSTA